MSNPFALLDSDDEAPAPTSQPTKTTTTTTNRPAGKKVPKSMVTGTNNADAPMKDDRRRGIAGRGSGRGRGAGRGRGRQFTARTGGRVGDRHVSGTGRGAGMKREGAGAANWGTVEDIPRSTDEMDALAKTVEELPNPKNEGERDEEAAKEEEEEDNQMSLEEYQAKVLAAKRQGDAFGEREARPVNEDFSGATRLERTEEDGIAPRREKKTRQRRQQKKNVVDLSQYASSGPSPRGRGGYRGGRGRGRGGGFGGRGRGQRKPNVNDAAAFPSLA